MGVSFQGLIPSRPVAFADLRGKTLALDGYNILYQFLSTIRDRFTGEPLRDSQGRITSHLSGVFYRSARLLEEGITPVYVFDGTPPAFKLATLEARGKVRAQAAEKWKEALAAGDVEKVRTYAQGAARLTPEMAAEAKELLGYMGIAWLQAPSEGEAQAARLLQQGKAWAVGSQDWDSLLFGAGRVVRNLAVTGRRKVAGKEQYLDISPELVELQAALQALGINREQLILLGMLIGTDYNPGGVKGVGPKTALKLVREHPSLEALFQAVPWEFSMPPQELLDLFLHPPVEDMDIPQARLQPSAVVEFLAGEHGFSRERIQGAVDKLRQAREQQQAGLAGFFRK
ncbi:MAG: flap endonuclease-1 [Candidatus Aenigmarchaeota archaeon]|nr:flap endonuclease-1 [Candidatus Aenigmarchaeota archaeon]